MTRSELKKELKKLESCIEILHGFITKPLCECLPHLGTFNENFKEENKIQLAHLIAIKNELLPLNYKSDEALGKIPHQPVKCY
ncbi:MAG TPA: hypothetical protein EYH57_05255 [Sulfurovum sp.]|nr:hypothetical protein [Sulfurovum sp.]